MKPWKRCSLARPASIRFVLWRSWWAPKNGFWEMIGASKKMLKISVGVETESCLQASMLKDIVQQKERLFASWPFLLLKKTSHNGTVRLRWWKKTTEIPGRARKYGKPKCAKGRFCEAPGGCEVSFVGPLATAICHDKSFGNRQVSWEEWKSWNEVFDLLEQKGEILSPGVLEKTRSLVWIGD